MRLSDFALFSGPRLLSPLTSFIGRQQEVVEIKRLLSTTRLLTLTGIGGCGKTRLALQVTTELLDVFEEQVWWVDLEELGDPTLVPQAVARALGVSEQREQSLMATLLDAPGQKKLLLVLDNCEHLAAACTQLARTFLHASLEVRLLTTSREALGIAGETIWPVPSLSLPDPCHLPPFKDVMQYEAVQLFVERAQAILPSFTLTQENVSAIVQVCHRLDGLPLAIELAAGRVKVLSVAQIAARLDDASSFLTTINRATIPRHQSLQATIDWSYHLLLEQERTLFCRLSVFASSFTLEAASTICTGEGLAENQTLDLLTRLVDKSLVKVKHSCGEVRYQLSETIQQYAQKKLQSGGDLTIWRERHLNWYMDFCAQAELELLGPQLTLWLDRLAMEHANLRTALALALESGKSECVARIGVTIWRFWLLQGKNVTDCPRWLAQATNDGVAELTMFCTRPALPLPSFVPERSPVRTKAKAELTIFALGRAQVYRNKQAIAPGDWKYTKAKELLFYLLSHGPRTKEQIGLALWPDASAPQLRSNFHTILHHLRLVLGKPEWILFEKGMYAFNHQLSYWFDVESFETSIAQSKTPQEAAQAICCLENAVKLYQGDFLENMLDAEWHLSLQRELQRLYLEALLRLGQLYFAEEQFMQAAEVYRRLIACDKFLEVAHRELMCCYVKQGEHFLALRHYQSLVKMMHDEFGSPPSPETRLLFERLRKGEVI